MTESSDSYGQFSFWSWFIDSISTSENFFTQSKQWDLAWSSLIKAQAAQGHWSDWLWLEAPPAFATWIHLQGRWTPCTNCRKNCQLDQQTTAFVICKRDLQTAMNPAMVQFWTCLSPLCSRCEPNSIQCMPVTSNAATSANPIISIKVITGSTGSPKCQLSLPLSLYCQLPALGRCTGLTEFTRTLLGAKSNAEIFVRCITAALPWKFKTNVGSWLVA